MTMPNITKKFLENYPRPVAGKQHILRDELLTGFGVRLTSGAASYVIEKRVNEATRRVTLCSVEEMTPEQARKKAFKLLQEKTSAPLKCAPRFMQRGLRNFHGSIDIAKITADTSLQTSRLCRQQLRSRKIEHRRDS